MIWAAQSKRLEVHDKEGWERWIPQNDPRSWDSRYAIRMLSMGPQLVQWTHGHRTMLTGVKNKDIPSPKPSCQHHPWHPVCPQQQPALNPWGHHFHSGLLKSLANYLEAGWWHRIMPLRMETGFCLTRRVAYPGFGFAFLALHASTGTSMCGLHNQSRYRTHCFDHGSHFTIKKWDAELLPTGFTGLTMYLLKWWQGL